MMLGWLSDAAVRASRLNRSAMPSPASRAGAITLIATWRSKAMSWARYTVAMPPRPSSPRISYSPSVACRTASSWAACSAAGAGGACGCTTAVAMLAWTPETSAPQRGQKRSAGPTGSPQRAQAGAVVIVWGSVKARQIYTARCVSTALRPLSALGSAPRRADPHAHLGGRGARAVVHRAPQRVWIRLRQRLHGPDPGGDERRGVPVPDPPQGAEARDLTRGQRLVGCDAAAVGDLRR